MPKFNTESERLGPGCNRVGGADLLALSYRSVGFQWAFPARLLFNSWLEALGWTGNRTHATGERDECV